MSLLAVVGLGSNLGDRLATMRAALARLARVAPLRTASHAYATAPVGPPQPEFLNAAALVAFEGSADELLDELLAIEAALGRVRRERWEARVIDLDWLWSPGVVVDSPRLCVPHPRLHERAFALVPLLEIVPHAVDPRSGHPYPIPPGDVRRTADLLTTLWHD